MLASLTTYDGYPVTIPEDGKGIHFLPRASDDLPKEIKGNAYWGRTQDGRPSVYFVINKDRRLVTLEYIQDNWFLINYSKDLGKYYTNIGSCVNKPYIYNLGTKSEPFLSEEDKRRLEKGKGKEEFSGPDNTPGGDKTMDDNIPIGDSNDDDDLLTLINTKMTMTTQVYAQGAVMSLLPDNPMNLQGNDPPDQGGSSNVPTTGGINLPSGGQMGPPSKGGSGLPGGSGGPPAGGGGGPLAGGGGGPPGGGGGGGLPEAGPAPGGQQNVALGPPLTKHLVGTIQIFDGNQSNSLLFEKQFGLYRMTNANHPLLSIPMQWVCIALSFIQGEKVNRWAHQYVDYLAGQVYGVNRQPAQYLPTDKFLWTDFTQAFRRQFKDTAEAEWAWAELLCLEMKENDIDGYIANFETLLIQAGWDQNEGGSVDLFKQGLRAGLQ